MIALIVPTRNRAHTLKRVAPSYFAQELVEELVFVIDHGTDDTPAVLREIARQFPDKTLKIVENAQRHGASRSRNIGVAASRAPYILFCDDDEYLEAGYARTCLAKLEAHGAGAVSGRRVYMRPGETRDQALARFGKGMRRSRPFRPVLCEYVNGATFYNDISLPFTNAIILTHRSLLETYPFDGFYARGNGYREETDFQMNLYVHGHTILVTNDCHSLHLPLEEVRTGGQRARPWARLYWSIYYTRYFFGKYYDAYAQKMGLRVPRSVALFAFACFALYRETLRPPLYRAAVWLVSRRRLASARRAA